jgi:hypothetical protein
MFSKLLSVKKFSKEKITIQQLVDIVKNNPQEELIKQIRSVEKKSKEYSNFKLKVNCITPHTIQKGLKNDDILSLSGYLYYDIDNFGTKDELDDTIKTLNDTFPISFICKSVGGLGISLLIKVDDTNFILDDTNFILVYQYVRSLLIDKGFNIDMYAGGISRKMNISSDIDCIFNDKVSLGVDKVSLRLFDELRSSGKNKKLIREYNILPNDTFLEIIPYEDLVKQIRLQTTYDKTIEGKYIIENMDYYNVYTPKNIPDGSKHKTYIAIINNLYALNSNITRQQVYSYIFHINNLQTKKMSTKQLNSIVKWLCDEIESTGEIRVKPRVKRIHFNENITKKEKQSMGAKLTATQKTNVTIKKIEDARMELVKKNILPTQKLVCEITNLSISTVKRNWNKQMVDINEVLSSNKEIIETIKEKTIDIPTIDEDNFWDGFTTERKFEEPDKYDKDWGESNGIDGLIESYDI